MSSQSLPNPSRAFISDIEKQTNVFKISPFVLTEVYHTYQQYFQVYKRVQKFETTLKIEVFLSWNVNISYLKSYNVKQSKIIKKKAKVFIAVHKMLFGTFLNHAG